MTKQNNVGQHELLTTIESTITFWKSLQKEQLIREGGPLCPLCHLIKTINRVSFQKGSARGACLVCPVKYFGHFHICMGIQHIYSTSDLTSEEFKSLRKTVIEHLNILITTLNSKTNYNKYLDASILEKKKMLKNNTVSTQTNKRRILKATKNDR